MIVALVWGTVLPVTAQNAGRLTVIGQGSVQSTPDMATISLGVTTEARTAAAALASNSSDTAEILKVISNSGIAERDVQTSGLNLSPVWNNRTSNSNSRPAIVGYAVSNQITIRVRDLTVLGQVLDAVVKSGATNFRGLSFGLQDTVPAMDGARTAAVQDAARKARLYAAAASVDLGKILEIREAGASSPRPEMLREMAMSEAVPIAAGEISITASVTIVYELVD